MSMSILVILGGGIGNCIQATPAIGALIKDGCKVDVLIHCNTTGVSREDFEILAIPGLGKVFFNDEKPKEKYDYQLSGPFTPGFKHNAKNFCRVKKYSRHYPESDLFYDMAKEIGVVSPKQPALINIVATGNNVEKGTVAIYPGSKHAWAMKRWDKYDKLTNHLAKVLLVGRKNDIISHGDPAWIERKWEWGKHVKTFYGSLKETAWAISQCRMFIGNDGGLAHVAAATGIPTFIIFGPSSVVKNTPFNDNAHAIHYNLKEPKLKCQPCQFNGKKWFDGGKIGCPYGMECMTKLTVKDVLDFIKDNK